MPMSRSGGVLDEILARGAFALSRAYAPTSPDFWDPLGPLASRLCPTAYVPEVRVGTLMRQRMHRVNHTMLKVLVTFLSQL